MALHSFLIFVVGISLLAIAGLPGIIAYFFQYSKRVSRGLTMSKGNKELPLKLLFQRDKNPSFEFLVLVTTVFNLGSLVVGLKFLTVWTVLDTVEHHSNTHQQINYVLPFIYAVAMVSE